MSNVIFTYQGYDVTVSANGQFRTEELDREYETATAIKAAIDNQVKYKAKVAKKAISLKVTDEGGVDRTLTGIHASRDKLLVRPTWQGSAYNEPDLFPDVAWLKGALKMRADLLDQAGKIATALEVFALERPTSWGRGIYAGKSIDEKYDVLLKDYEEKRVAAEGSSLEAELKRPKESRLKD